MLIEIKGVQFVNKGAELMLYAILQEINKLWPDVEICLAPSVHSPYQKRAKIGAYQKLNIRKNIVDLAGLFYFVPKSVRQFFKNKWGIVTEADIDLVLDSSGFSYGDQWNTLMLKQTAIEVKRLKKHNKPYIFMPQALGPFSFEHNQKWAKLAFTEASIVFARESGSYHYVEKLNCENINLIQSPDFTNLISSVLPNDYSHLIGCVAIIPNSKMLSFKNPNKQWHKNYVDILVASIEILIKQGEKVFLLNHEGKADKQLCQQIKARLNVVIEIIEPDDALVIKAIIGKSRLVLSSRYHGCISALSQGVPCIATSWSHKYEQLFAEYSVEEFVLTPELKGDDINEFIINFLECFNNTQKKIANYSVIYKEKSQKMWLLIKNEVKNYI
ncbi:MAG: hypothetical protein COB35_10595 [Gammaproteobacteria bacterium]|nr:MAG: hypothetical protein COB35_10595 [Gammaproteobacteria bacterium]